MIKPPEDGDKGGSQKMGVANASALSEQVMPSSTESSERVCHVTPLPSIKLKHVYCTCHPSLAWPMAHCQHTLYNGRIQLNKSYTTICITKTDEFYIKLDRNSLSH